ncbi:pentatricopeptide repeat-containing protein At2g13600-like [Mercurialis annua]|uniref:pentatricopeptide repeat-containing protein At2g13600-like n=1 Tax=Mercurialis annua TaxID=3986 RepID=UPI00216073AB|nr:pentatricopeptide repeat-containing protein At2g13600-like [Mercurialis annua]
MANIPAQLFQSISPPPPPPPPRPISSNYADNAPLNSSTLPLPRRPGQQSDQPIHTNISPLYNTKPLTSTTYASILSSCTSPNLPTQLHAHVIKSGFHAHDFIQTKLLQTYAKFGFLESAQLLFDLMPLRNLYSWLAIINVYSYHGLYNEAFTVFHELLVEDIGLEFFVFPVVLKICSGLGNVDLGRQLHGMLIKYRFFANIYVGNALIDMYGKCGSLDDAKQVILLMPETDSVSWNSVITACAANGMVYEALEFLEKMKLLGTCLPNLVTWSAVIGGFAQNGYDEEAIELVVRMQEEGIEPNARTLASVLPACARLQKLSFGKAFHGYITRHGFMCNPFVVNGLVDVYRRCGDMNCAVKIFSKFSVKNEVSYNTMIVGYCESGDVSNAKQLFDSMELLGVKRDLISWNSMISGYVDNFMFDEALYMFSDLLKQGIEPDSFTLGSVLAACADTASLRQGKAIHAHAIVKALHCNTFVGGALVEMYSKCQDLRAAQMAFNDVHDRDTPTWNVLLSCYSRCNQIEGIQNLLQKMREDGFEPNVHTWNGILAGHVENGHLDVAMQLFSEMQMKIPTADIYTIGIILPTCSKLATLERGKQVHAHAIKRYYDSDVHIGAALLDMYAKCGSIRHAVLAYNRISSHNLVCHNAMLTAYAMHGYGEEGIALFRRILADGFQADHVTFLSVLSSCVHAGSVEAGHEFFDLMRYYDVKPELKHYTSMVDLLSRSGQLNEAYELIMKMPMEADSIIWSALLGGCVIHGCVELGEFAAERVIELEPNNSGNYVLLANLYGYGRRWLELARIRETMKDRGIRKSPGCSWIEDKDEVHSFVAGDRCHKRREEIYSTLQTLSFHMRMYCLTSH